MTLNTLHHRYASGSTPTQLIRDLYQKITTHNDPALFIHLPPLSELLEIAAHVESLPRDLPLWGLPFVVKDNIDVAGWPTTAACPDYSYTPTEDAHVVHLLRAAGAIPIGKTNLDQFATGLVGTRSPYGIPRNAIAPGMLPGGSSSGSASAVAAGLCTFALGTDTAGSGRVPAAFQELIGCKPTRGLLSTSGVVPACRALDCVSIFARTPADAGAVLRVVAQYDPADSFARPIAQAPAIPQNFRFGVPTELDFAGDPDTPALFAAAIANLEAKGGTAVPIDLTPFTEAARLLYDGPWVAERWAAVGEFVKSHPDSIFPVTRKILESSQNWDAAATFNAQYRLRELARQTEPVWKSIDVLLLPTTPRLYTVEENLADPIATNSILGRYTNFMNLLDLAAVAIPAGRARHGTAPWGVTLAAPAGSDLALLDLAARLLEKPAPSTASPRLSPPPATTPVVVCGAHMNGLALHWQLADRGAVFRQRTTTAPAYRLFAMPPSGSIPPRPALIHDAENGTAIEVEVWDLPTAVFGDFVAQIPAPLGIGKVTLADGRALPGFIAEPRATTNATEITHLKSWRTFLSPPQNP